ncbi:MAG: adenosylmethionine--8-amino-7-oxononanoate transaminase [Planctomycetota bacterium]|nr:adenosylmethionine--8-amino-7-oxononanoate transaminase [Planctomycetota bacterium]
MSREFDANELRHLDRNVVWHAFSQMADYDGLIIDSAEGCWLTDIDGKRYLDGASSLWCNIHGHRHPHIDQAIRDQLDRVAHVTNLGMSHPTTIRLAKRLVDLAPGSLGHVFFSSDGASSVEVAMKLAFQYWRQCEIPEPKRTTFLALGSAYHGDTLGTVSVGGVSRFHSMFEPLLFPVLRGPCPDSYRLPNGVGPERATEHYLMEYRKIFEHNADQIIAVIVEPLVQGAAGMVVQPAGFLRGLAELCKEFGCLLIADEIAVGMGRTGKMFACEHESVEPDFLCIGKGLTGGYLPMSAALTTHRIWQAFLGKYEDSKSFLHGHTYGGNALSAAAAQATLDIFERDETLQKLPAKAELLRNCLDALRECSEVGDVRQCGMMAAIELVSDKAMKTPLPWQNQRAGQVCRRVLEKGVWLRPIGNVIPIIPPLTSTFEELELLADSLRYGLS